MRPLDISRPPVVRFGVFEADLRSGELRKAGVRIALQDQPFRVLARLLEHPGAVVTRDELRQELWPADTFVDFEHGVNVAIKRVRDALGDDAETPRFVETLPRRGYRFIAPVASNAGHDGDDPCRPDPKRTLRARRRRLAWTVAGLTAIGGLVTATLVVSRRPPPLAGGGAILIADFVNQTGDEVFDGTLRQGLVVQLAQSPFFNTVSRERLRDTLTEMTRSPDGPVIGEVAREVCQRVGAKATVNGSIAPLGRNYVIGLETLDCLSGETIAIEQAEVSGREQVLAALGSLTSKLRRRLGESLASIRRFDTHLERATTPSLDALKAFTIGQDIFLREGDGGGIPFLTRAIELDRDFSMAYARLSTIYGVLGQRKEEVRYAQAAYARRDRVTAPERFYIDGRQCIATYYSGGSDCFMNVNEQWRRTYPSDPTPYGNLAAGYLVRGQFERALENGLEAIRLNPDAGIPYLNVIDAYMGLNRFADARRVSDVLLARHLVDAWNREVRFRLAFLAGDDAGMAAERRAVAGLGIEPLVIEDDSEVAAFRGRLKESRLLRARAERLVPGRPALGLNLRAIGARIDAAVGASVRIPDMPAPPADDAMRYGLLSARYNLAVAALLSGNVQRAAAMLRDGDVPLDRLLLVDSARALLAVETGDAGAADRLSDTTPRELGLANGHVPPYLRGLAYLYAGDGAHAVVEFQQIIDHRGVDSTSPLYPLAYLQHARASVLIGDASRARSDYETFLEFWEDADVEVPILRKARSEFGALTLEGPNPP